MSPQPSYYDSIGLLAICDAIDSVQGIPFHALEPPKPITKFRVSSSFVAEGSKNLGGSRSTPIQHTLLSHVPVTGVLSPVGSIPYCEQQRVVYSQLANTGQLPPQPAPHTVGGVRPNIPVAHNLNGTSSQRSPGPPSILGSPGVIKKSTPSQIPNHASLVQSTPPHNYNESGSGVKEAQVKKAIGTTNGEQQQAADVLDPTPQQETFPQTVQQSAYSKLFPGTLTTVAVGPQQLTGKSDVLIENHDDTYSVETEPLKRVTTDHKFGILGADADSSMSNSTTQVYDDSRPSTPGSPAENMLQAYHIEVCQICGRDFKGRKAATHKQQHIRRLHPAEYTPKRGGKKSRIDESM